MIQRDPHYRCPTVYSQKQEVRLLSVPKVKLFPKELFALSANYSHQVSRGSAKLDCATAQKPLWPRCLPKCRKRCCHLCMSNPSIAQIRKNTLSSHFFFQRKCHNPTFILQQPTYSTHIRALKWPSTPRTWIWTSRLTTSTTVSQTTTPSHLSLTDHHHHTGAPMPSTSPGCHHGSP